MTEPVDLRHNVYEFHRVVIGGELPPNPAVPEEGVARRRMRLIAEEFIEVMECVFDARLFDPILRDLLRIIENEPLEIAENGLSHLAHFARELADLEYVCEGAFIGFGIDSRPVHAEVQRANMDKFGGPVRPDGKRLKPPGWTPPDIKSIIERQMARVEKWGVWCLEDRAWCSGTVGSHDHAAAQLPLWSSGEAASVDPKHFHYELREVE